MTEWRSNSKVEILPGTARQMGGPHPQPVHLDEVELMVERERPFSYDLFDWDLRYALYVQRYRRLYRLQSGGHAVGHSLAATSRRISALDLELTALD